MARFSIHSNPLTKALMSAFVVLLATARLEARAETLDNLKDSKAMQNFRISESKQQRGAQNAPPHNTWLRGIDPSSNFAAAWMSSNAPQILLNWAGAKLPYFSFRRPHGIRTSSLVVAEVELSNFERVSCKLAIMVPHPSIAPLVEANMLDEFRKLRPPKLEVVNEKSIPLAQGQGMLYEHKKSGGSLVIDIAQHGIIQISTREYQNATVLVDIAKGLDIERLNRKLNS